MKITQQDPRVNDRIENSLLAIEMGAELSDVEAGFILTQLWAEIEGELVL